MVQRQPRHHHVVVRVELGGHGAWRRGWRRATRCGSITPFGSLVEPLVNCRMASAVRVVAPAFERIAARDAGRPGSTVLIDSVGGSPSAGSMNGASWWSISSSLASAWRMRARVWDDELLDRAHPHRQRQHHDGGAGQPAAACTIVTSGAGWSGRGWPRGRRGSSPCAWSAAADRPGVVVELGPRDRRPRRRRASPRPRRRGPPLGASAAVRAFDDRAGGTAHGTRRYCPGLARREGIATTDGSQHDDSVCWYPSVVALASGVVMTTYGPLPNPAPDGDERPRSATPRPRQRDRAALAGPVGRRRHVPHAEPHRPAGRRAHPTPTATSSTCSTCSRTRRVRASTSATRSATSAPTSTPATSG